MAKQVDLSKYAEKIFAKDDLPLFSEAAVAANAGALRAAYVMIWLSCAESLKRRFRESSKYDNAAGRILARIDSLEKSERSVDKVLLKEAREYGLYIRLRLYRPVPGIRLTLRLRASLPRGPVTGASYVCGGQCG